VIAHRPFLAGVPATSAHSALEGFKAAGMQPCDLGIAEDRLDARSLFLTPNTTTVYGMVEIDVKSGPFVVDIPAVCSDRWRTPSSAMSWTLVRSAPTRARAEGTSSRTRATTENSRKVRSKSGHAPAAMVASFAPL